MIIKEHILLNQWALITLIIINILNNKNILLKTKKLPIKIIMIIINGNKCLIQWVLDKDMMCKQFLTIQIIKIFMCQVLV